MALVARTFGGAGSGDYLSVADDLSRLRSPSSALTLACWVYPEASGGDAWAWIVGKMYATSSPWQSFAIQQRDSVHGRFRGSVATSSSGLQIVDMASGNTWTGSWKFIALRWADGEAPTMKIWNPDNTEYVTRVGGTIAGGTVIYQDEPFRVGISENLTSEWAGNVDGILLHNAKLSDAEILDFMAGTIPTLSGGYWPLRGASPEVDESAGSNDLVLNGSPGTTTGVHPDETTEKVTSDRGFLYDLNSIISSELDLQSKLLNIVSSERIIDYLVNLNVNNSLEILYDSSGKVFSQRQFLYDLISKVADNFEIQYFLSSGATLWDDGFETSDASGWSGGASATVGATISYPTTDPYEGLVNGRCEIASGGTTRFARWILTGTDISLVENDDIYFGYAIKLAPGFYNIDRGSSVRLSTIDNFNVTTTEDRLGLWIYSDDTVRILKHKEGSEVTIINLGAQAIPEDEWIYIEQRFLLSPVDGVARTEIWFNGILQGSTTLANLYEAFESPFQRFRGGIADVSGTTDGIIVIEFDDFYTSDSRRGPGIQKVLSNRQFQFALNEALFAELDLQSNLLNIASSKRDIEYLVNSKANSDLDVAFDSFEIISSKRDIEYLVDSRIQDSLELPFDSFEIVSSQRQLPYDLVLKAASDAGIAYDVAERILSPRVLLYDLAETVNKQLEIEYGISGLTFSQRLLPFNLFNTVSVPNSFEYDVFNKALRELAVDYDLTEIASSDLESIYDVLSSASSDRELKYTFIGLVQKNLDLLYGLEERIESNNEIAYSLYESLASDRAIDYEMFQTAEDSLLLPYEMSGVVQGSRSLSYDVLAKGVADTALSYSVLSATLSELQTPFEVETRLLADLELMYGLSGKTLSDLELKYAFFVLTGIPTDVDRIVSSEISKGSLVRTSLKARLLRDGIRKA